MASDGVCLHEEGTQAMKQRRLSGGEWHRSWQRAFPEHFREVQICPRRRADIAPPGQNFIVEIQHSWMSRREAVGRERDYAAEGKSVIWVLDGTDRVESIRKFRTEGNCTFLLDVELQGWFANFDDQSHLLVHVDDEHIFYIRRGDIRNGMAEAALPPMTFEEVVGILRDSAGSWVEKLERRPTLIRLWVLQDPPGAGKTYGLVERALRPEVHPEFAHYDIFLFLTKPHTAKEVLRREFDARLEAWGSTCFENNDETAERVRAYWRRVRRKDGSWITAYFATGDSLLCSVSSVKLGDLPSHDVGDCFESLCKLIGERGPGRVSERDGYFGFKGQCCRMSARMLICWDEATKFCEAYLDALVAMMTRSGADALLSGDIMQSIEMEENMFSKLVRNEAVAAEELLRRGVELKLRVGNQIRRAGSKLVHLYNEVIPYAQWAPAEGQRVEAAADVARESDGEFYVHAMDRDYKGEALRIVDYVTEDAKRLRLLPSDLIVVCPFVRGRPLLHELQPLLHEMWRELLSDGSYREELLRWDNERQRLYAGETAREYLEWYDGARPSETRRAEFLAFLHYSEPGRPVDTSLSERSTRIVSIHAAQGDGRRACYALDLSEAALLRYAGRSDNLKYASLKNVALTRSKCLLRVFLQPVMDELWLGLSKYISGADRLRDYDVPQKTLFLSGEEFDWSRVGCFGAAMDAVRLSLEGQSKDWAARARSGVIEDEHHVTRLAVFCTLFLNSIIRDELGKGTKRQSVAIAKKMMDLGIETYTSAGEYYKFLHEYVKGGRDNLRHVPFYQYQSGHPRDLLAERSEEIRGHIRRAQQYLRDLVKDPFAAAPPDKWACLALQHLIDIESSGPKCGTRLEAIHTALSSEAHESHYDPLSCVKGIFDRLGTKGGARTWLINHMVYLGTESGRKLDFPVATFLRFVAHSDEAVTIFHLCPKLDELSVRAVALDALLKTALVLHSSGERNVNRFEGRRVTVRVVSLVQLKHYDLDLHDFVKENWSEHIAPWIVRGIRETWQRYNKLVTQYFEAVGLDTERAAEKFKRCPEYIQTALKDYEGDDEGGAERLASLLDECLGRRLKATLRSLLGRAAASGMPSGVPE
jgi:hypothetical protein